MQLFSFRKVGDWGAIEYPSVSYPWDKWIDGNTWGCCPEKFGYSGKTLRERLRVTARELGMEVDIFEYTLHDNKWILFQFVSAEDASLEEAA
jgi:hypothetical protein